MAGRNNIVYQCAVDNLATGPNVGQSSLNEAATIFLTRYHNYSGLDSTEMIYMLSNIDFTQNASITLGDLTMIINPSGALTSIHWGFRDSARFDVSFQNNFPVSFYDERQISSNSTPTPIPTPTIPELQTWSIPLLLCVMMTFGLLVCHKKTKHNLVKKV